MDDLKLEQDLTESQGDLETVATDSEVLEVDGVDPEPRVPRRRFIRRAQRFAAFALLVSIAGLAIYRPISWDYITYHIIWDFVSLGLAVTTIIGIFKLYGWHARKIATRPPMEISLKRRLLPTFIALVALGLLGGILYGAYVLLDFVSDKGLLDYLFLGWLSWVVILFQFVHILVIVIVMFKLYSWYTRKFENREPVEISLKGQALPIFIGAVVGVLLVGILNLLQWLLGIVEITIIDWFVLDWTNIIGDIFVRAFGVGVFEELVFRVILLRHIQVFLGSYAAIVLSAIIFGLVHILNSVFSLPDSLILGLGLGTLLGVVYLATNNIWMAAAVHSFYSISVIVLANALAREFTANLLSFYILFVVLPLIIAIPFLIYAIRKGHIVRPRLLTSLRS